VTDVLPGAGIGEPISTRVGQTKGIVQLAVGQQSGIGRDRGTAKFAASTGDRNRASAPRCAIVAAFDPPKDAEF
jgi:hypothetical protein